MTKACEIEDCDNKNHGRGMCDKHYKLWQRRQNPEYSIWLEIKRRCYNPNFKDFANYGGRGIKMCDEWLHDAQAFIDEVGARPTDQHQLDRIDNDGDYEPGNCRWATRSQQANNKRNNALININGRIQTITQWAEESNLSRTTIRTRYYRGWQSDKLLIPKRGV